MSIKRFTKNKLFSFTLICFFSFVFFGVTSVEAAALRINGSASTLSVGQTTTLSVVLNAEGVAVNNAEAVISFPKDLVEVVSISKNENLFPLWVEGPAFSNATGLITFNGGVPTPGFSGSAGSIVSLVVRAKKAGTATLSFSSAAVRANDGLGTDVLSSKSGKSISIEEKQEIPPPTPPVSTTTSQLQITSSTHPNQSQWYKVADAVLKWNIPTGVDAVQTSVDTSTTAVPRVLYSPAISTKTVNDLEDGVWYFKARARKGGVWGSTSTYAIRVDTAAPEQKQETVFSYDDAMRVLSIDADIFDETSGIDRYELSINNVVVKTILTSEFTDGTYELPVSASGNTMAKLVAVDRAGNTLESADTFYATGQAGIILEPIPSAISNSEQLLIRGTTKTSNSNVRVYVKRQGDEPIVLETTATGDASFFVLTPKLQSGTYDIWAEAGEGATSISSAHMQTVASSKSLLTLGAQAVLAIIFAITLLVLGAYRFGRTRRGARKLNIRSSSVKGDSAKALLLLRKRLEEHLEILQETRHHRVLTKEEKEIKDAIETDLDEIDRFTQEQHEGKGPHYTI